MTRASITLPGTTVAIPPLGLGTWAWGDKSTWGMGGYDADLSERTIRDAWDASLDAGVTFIDTAEVYGSGESERIIGRARRPRAIPRRPRPRLRRHRRPRVRTPSRHAARAVEAESAALTADKFLLKQMEDLRRAKETAALKESEMILLRKENNWLKDKLREKTAQVNALKAGTVTSTSGPRALPKPTAELQPGR